MSQYDDYFTNDDKPFAENFNDALLLSNVFDLTVPIELPKMFNNGEWSTGTGQRKAGVSIIQTEGIDNNKIEIRNNSLIANNDATVLITVYPNFNQYGNLQKVYWEFEDGAGENLTVDVLTEQRTVLLTNIPNNSVLSSVPYLQQLNRFILRLNFEGGTGIKKLGFIMQNKQQDRYGAEVGINDVNGLDDRFANLETIITENYNALDTAKVDKVAGKQLSTNDFDDTYRSYLVDLVRYQSDYVEHYNAETVIYAPNNPWKYQQLGRVVHITGNFICRSSLPSTNPIKVALRLPKPFQEVVAIQQGVGKNTYTLKIDEAGNMYIYNYGTTSISNFPANVALPVHITYLMEW